MLNESGPHTRNPINEVPIAVPTEVPIGHGTRWTGGGHHPCHHMRWACPYLRPCSRVRACPLPSHRNAFLEQKNKQIYQRGPKWEADWRHTNVGLASDPPPRPPAGEGVLPLRNRLKATSRFAQHTNVCTFSHFISLRSFFGEILIFFYLFGLFDIPRIARSPPPPRPTPRGRAPRPPPLCDIPSGCCCFTGPWTVTRSSLRMLRRVAAFCRPLQPVLPLVSFPRSRTPIVFVLGLCWMWRDVPFARQQRPVVGVLGVVLVVVGVV